MAIFTTRIELIKTEQEDYMPLHIEMAKEGFLTYIFNNGIEHKLSYAEYNKEGEYTIKQVYDSAERAANKIGKEYYLLVTVGKNRKDRAYKLMRTIKLFKDMQ